MTKPRIIYQKWIKRDDLRANPDLIYIFGDNANRIGLGGQAAAMRGEPNAIGIATLWAPGDPFSDFEIGAVMRIIDQDISKVEIRMDLFDLDTVVFPMDGIGTGLANMIVHCPQAKEYLDTQLLVRLGIKNGLSLGRVELIVHNSTAPGETDG